MIDQQLISPENPRYIKMGLWGPRENGGDMASGKSRFQWPKEQRIALVVVVAAFWIWTNLFHDVGISYKDVMIDAALGARPFGTYLNCAAHPLGIAIGALGALALFRKGRLGETSLNAGFAACAALHIAYYLVLQATRSYIMTSVLELLIGIAGVLVFVPLFLRVCDSGKRSLIALVIGYIVGRKLVYLFIGATIASVPVLCVCLVHGVFLLPLFVERIVAARRDGRSRLCQHAASQTSLHNKLATSAAIDDGSPSAPADVEAAILGKPHRGSAGFPRPLIIHLISYGMGLGLIHGMRGFDDTQFTRYAVLSIVGLMVVVALVYFCTKNIAREEDLWQRVRGVVFPLAIISYSFVSIASSSRMPSIIAESGGNVYSALLAIGCLMMIKETTLQPVVIVCSGLFFKNIGFFMGILMGYAFGNSGIIADHTATAIVSLAVFIVFSLGTFWIGSEQSMRRWWGLRKERSPKYRHDQVLQDKCEVVAQSYQLTAREGELLLMLAMGKRATQIKEECSLSIFTVRNHIQNIYRKLDVHSASELELLLEDVQVIAS